MKHLPKFFAPIILGFFLFALLLPTAVFACVGGSIVGEKPTTPESLFSSASTVFQGRVLKTNEDRKITGTSYPEGTSKSVTVEVTKSWKGSFQNPNLIVEADWICGGLFLPEVVGKEYIFYSKSTSTDKLQLSHYDEDRLVMELVTETDNPYVRYLYPQKNNSLIIIASISVAICFVLLVFYRRRIRNLKSKQV